MSMRAGVIKQYLFAGLVLGLCALLAAAYERGYIPVKRAYEFRFRLLPRFYEVARQLRGTARQYHEGASKRVRSGAMGKDTLGEMRRELYEELDRRRAELNKPEPAIITDGLSRDGPVPEHITRLDEKEDRTPIVKEEKPRSSIRHRGRFAPVHTIVKREPAPAEKKPAEKKKTYSLTTRELVPPISLIQKKKSPNTARVRVGEKSAPAVERPPERKILSDLHRPFAHGSRSEQSVALSFDSGETGGDISCCHMLIDRLIAARTPTTFFLTGRFIESHPDIVRKLARVNFFELGNHSYSHPDLTAQSVEKILNELRRTQEALKRITGRQAVLFRAPYGKLNSKVIETAAGLGLRAVQWDVSAEDYRRGADGVRVARTVLGAATNGSVVVMHMSGHTRAGGEAIDAILEGLKKKGLRPVTVSMLLRDSAEPRKEQARIIDMRRDSAN